MRHSLLILHDKNHSSPAISILERKSRGNYNNKFSLKLPGKENKKTVQLKLIDPIDNLCQLTYYSVNFPFQIRIVILLFYSIGHSSCANILRHL
jgi:hypothetical protein